MNYLFSCLAVLSVTALVACGKKEVALPEAPVSVPSAPSELRVAVDPSYKPFTYKTESGELTGFDVDIARALCDQLKTKCTFIEQGWDDMIPGLQANQYDAIVSSMSITEERKQLVDFTGKYYSTPSCIVVKIDQNVGTDSSELKGKRIAVIKGTTQEKYALGELSPVGVQILPYETMDQIYKDIGAGNLDGAVSDLVEANLGFLSTPQGKTYKCAGGGGRIRPEFDEKYFGPGIGIAIRKGDDALRKSLNEGIDAIRANGKWKELSNKYVPGLNIWGS